MSEAKLDLCKLHKDEYVAPKKPQLVKTRPAKYLAIAGRGKPGDELFQSQIGSLYGVAYTLKMASKAAGQDYKVATLEGLYWPDDPAACVFGQALEALNWKLLIRTPDFITAKQLKEAIAALAEKGKALEAGEVKIEKLSEGLCVQMLHVGPYAAEKRTIDAMTALMQENRLVQAGPHHEIYLSDPRRVPEERLKTILRMPVRKA
jgi:hypothetical protein